MREISVLKSRIIEYLDFKGDNKAQFYHNTGISNGILSQKTGLSEDNIMKFLNYYTDCNPIWFLTGVGNKVITQQKNNDPLSVTVNLLEKIIQSKDETINAKDNTIENLQKNLEDLRYNILTTKALLKVIPSAIDTKAHTG